MIDLLSGAGLRENEKANATGVQTERRGEAWTDYDLKHSVVLAIR
jgi:hypothetical protein